MKHFTKDDTVMLLIDHQEGTLGWSKSRSKQEIISRTRLLARLAKALNIPVVLTTSMEEYAQGPIIPDLKELLPEEFEKRVKRMGVTNAWNDENYKKAVLEAAGNRKNVIMAGLTNDVCIVYPSISMVEEGYDVQVVFDAGGSPTQTADDIARITWEKNGVRTTTANQLVAELIHSWATEDGQKVVPIVTEEVFG
ncbi:isochorismatase [Arenibacter sp. N53]|uniref:isochorismatase family protein n=1 Tax=Arenibacter TaxID=178469 RepID=UPI000CD3F25C|nr:MULTISPECIES: isochorismatase family protein [Arenibacter]MCM4154314.1 isochorismatase [Arenibacter sp. N53]